MSNLAKNVAFRALEVETELERNLIAVSDSKLDDALKNKLARLKACDKFVKASLSALQFIAKHSDDQTVEELCNYKCYKTAQRILSFAEYATKNKKADSNTQAFFNATSNKHNDSMTASTISFKMTKDLRRDAKTLKAMQFFNLISIANKSFRDAISKDDLIKIA